MNILVKAPKLGGNSYIQCASLMPVIAFNSNQSWINQFTYNDKPRRKGFVVSLTHSLGGKLNKFFKTKREALECIDFCCEKGTLSV